MTARRQGGWPLEPAFEHALVVLEGEVLVGEQVVRPWALAYLGVGRGELVLSAAERARVLLLGGEPFGEPVLMWWNFVVRSRDELDAAYRQWEEGDPRFGRAPLPAAADPGPEALLAAAGVTGTATGLSVPAGPTASWSGDGRQGH